MAEEQVEPAEQSGQMAEQNPDRTSADVGGNVQPDSSGENSPQEITAAAETDKAQAEQPVAGADQSPDHENKIDVSQTNSAEDQSDQHSQDSNPVPSASDANSNLSQDLNASVPDVGASTAPLEQSANVDGQPDEDTNNDSHNQDPDRVSPQETFTEPTDQESAPPEQKSSSPEVSDPELETTGKDPGDSGPDSTESDTAEADAEQAKPQAADESPVVATMVSASDIAHENLDLDNDQATAEETTSPNHVEDAEEAPADSCNEVPSSEQTHIQEQTVEDIPENAAENTSGLSCTPQSPPVASSNSTPDGDAVQTNNNNEMSRARQFSGESVRIPTAQGDMKESLSNSGSGEELRDPAMYKMRSSLPVDAYGDSKSNHLPALIHPDPRLAHSLPASSEFPSLPARNTQSKAARRIHSHIPRIPSGSGSTKAEVQDKDVRRAVGSARLPPSVMKMSTVMVSARKRAVLNRNASVFYEEREQRKVISLDQAINSRPPMPFDLDGPGPWSYSPRNKPLNEDNSPEYTFGHRLNEKTGGGRTAYSKTWFNSNSGFTQKVHYEKRWPSPAHYNSTRPLLGRRKATMVDYPSFTIGVRSNFSISKRGSESEPAPNEYNRSKSDIATLKTAPSYTISRRHKGTKLWSRNELTPGPGTYNPRWGHSSSAVHRPSFTIRGIRRLKSHQLGPHATF